DPAGAELAERVHQIGLIVGLERAGYHRTGGDAERLHLRQIILQREVRWRIALVGHDREAVIDDVAMAVEQAALLSDSRQSAQCNGGAAGEECAAVQSHRISPSLPRTSRGTDALDRRRGFSIPWKRTTAPRARTPARGRRGGPRRRHKTGSRR